VTNDQRHFEILVRRVAHYFQLRSLPILVVLILSLFPFIAPLADGFDTLAFVTFVPFCLSYILYPVYFFWLAGKQAAALKYWIQDSTIRIDEGIFLRKRKSIPLDRITDIVLIQGSIMRFFGFGRFICKPPAAAANRDPRAYYRASLTLKPSEIS